MFGHSKVAPLPERLAAIGGQANKAGEYEAAAKIYEAAFELGGSTSKRISAANVKPAQQPPASLRPVPSPLRPVLTPRDPGLCSHRAIP